MVSKNQSQNPNFKPFQNPRPSIPSSNKNPNRKSVHVGGIEVQFPYQPYGTQLAFMARVISTLDRAHRDGHCHALLESPTGTGKSLSLLCSTLAWQQSYKSKCQVVNKEHLNPNPEAFTDPLNHGGGFVPEIEPSGNVVQEGSGLVQQGSDGKSKKKTVPVIFYSSRTHSQISQVIREYRKTAYRVPMSILASRKHYCTNPRVRGKENIDEECKMLLRNREAGCCEFKNANKVKAHPSLQKGGCHEVHDIEDLVKVGQVVKGCSYYAATSMAGDAHLVFCPYNYIINPVIRGAMDVDIKGAIVILDEAHNIEDIARDSGSMDLEEDTLHKLQTELDTLSPVDPMVYEPLCEMVQDLVAWMNRRKHKLEKREFQHYVSCWTGDEAIKELQEANITRQCFPILFESARKAIKVAIDLESEVPHLSGMAVLILEGLFSSLTYFFSGNGARIYDFQLALRRYVKRDARNGLGYPTHSINLWCMNPSVVFKEIADLSLSVILTSGTLSPMNSFSSELGVHFGTSLEAPHVIDVKSQVLAGIISTGPGNYPLNASYKTADGFEFQDALGQSLEEILRIVPSGSLLFFPSYKLMEKLCDRWRETGQWSRLNARKSLFVEPRGGTQGDFENVLKGYYTAVRKPAFGKKRRTKKTELVGSNTTNTKEGARDGAALLAVCRGKVSEGIDFSDNNARVVIIIGIPFPNVNDIQVGLKKKYNDTYKSSKNLLSGSDWYCQQAFRALNQAAGRCIRHISDYGAIILIDERYREERNRVYISKWLRNSIRQYGTLDASLQDLRSFFRDVKEKFDNNKINVLESPSINDENFTLMEEQKASTGKKFRKVNKPVCPKQKVMASLEHDDTFSSVRSLGKVKGQEPLRSGAAVDPCLIEYIDLEDSSEKASRCHASSCNGTSEEPDIYIVKETPVNCSIPSSSPRSFSRDDYSSSTVVQASVDFSDQFSPQSISLRDHVRVLSTAQSSTIISPEREAATSHSSIKDIESSLNLSVNSHVEKRRVLVTSLVNGALHVQSNASDSKGAASNIQMNRKIDFDGEKPSNSNNEELALVGESRVAEIDAFKSIEKFSYSAKRQAPGGWRTTRSKELVLVGESRVAEIDAFKSIEKFSYSAKRQTPGGWRTTRSKLRLPRRALLSREDDD